MSDKAIIESIDKVYTLRYEDVINKGPKCAITDHFKNAGPNAVLRIDYPSKYVDCIINSFLALTYNWPYNIDYFLIKKHKPIVQLMVDQYLTPDPLLIEFVNMIKNSFKEAEKKYEVKYGSEEQVDKVMENFKVYARYVYDLVNYNSTNTILEFTKCKKGDIVLLHAKEQLTIVIVLDNNYEILKFTSDSYPTSNDKQNKYCHFIENM